MQTSDNKSLFTLTAEEVDVVQDALEETIWVYKDEIRKWEGRRAMEEHKFFIRKSQELLNRIKEFQHADTTGKQEPLS